MVYLRKFIYYVRAFFEKISSNFSVLLLRHYYKVKVGKNVKITNGFRIHGWGKIYIGDNTIFGSKVVLGTTNVNAIIDIGKNCFINGSIFYSAESIKIGDHCILSDCELMDTSSHGIAPTRRNDPAAIKISKIIVENNVWIGSKVMVLPGAKIGKNSIIGVSSVVTKDIESNVFAAGIPAKKINSLAE